MAPSKPDRETPQGAAEHAPAVSFGVPALHPPLETLRKRADFLAAARARRHATPSLVLQARKRADAGGPMRIGFTCSKKVGNAVARNRAKRRLRAIAREVFPSLGTPGWDYVLIGRQTATATRAFVDLRRDLETALARIHTARTPR